MKFIFLIIHIAVCTGLIFIILLQQGKGAGMGISLGGGSSQTLFGSSGATTFLQKITASIAIIFMITSMALSVFYSKTGTASMMEGIKIPASIMEKSVPENTQESVPK